MDMDEILSILHETALETAPTSREKVWRSLEETQPYYDRLCQILGEADGDRFWNAISALTAAEEDSAFLAGLCLGLRLMALCR